MREKQVALEGFSGLHDEDDDEVILVVQAIMDDWMDEHEEPDETMLALRRVEVGDRIPTVRALSRFVQAREAGDLDPGSCSLGELRQRATVLKEVQGSVLAAEDARVLGKFADHFEAVSGAQN